MVAAVSVILYVAFEARKHVPRSPPLECTRDKHHWMRIRVVWNSPSEVGVDASACHFSSATPSVRWYPFQKLEVSNLHETTQKEL